MKLLFLVPYPLNESPSQRFRFEQYFELLEANGFSIDVQPFLDSHNGQIFFKPGRWIKKGLVLIQGFVGRFKLLFSIKKYDIIFIHREATPVGPPVIEWFIACVLKMKIIYDFDDAIWMTDRKAESHFLRFMKWRSKVASICRWSYRVSCGNTYLCEFASNYNRNVIYNPTTLDTASLHNPSKHRRPLVYANKTVIGWTGTHSTLKYLREIEAVLGSIEKEFPEVLLLVIADHKPELKLSSLRFKPWNLETEIEDLMMFDIGLMPLPDDEWSKGKCGFKALQYMSLEIPTIASPVGVNKRIIQHGVNGYLASSGLEWNTALRDLIKNRILREKTKREARETVVNHYSVESNAANFLALFALS